MPINNGTKNTFNTITSIGSNAIPTTASRGPGGYDMSAWSLPRRQKLDKLVVHTYSMGTTSHSLPSAIVNGTTHSFGTGYHAGEKQTTPATRPVTNGADDHNIPVFGHLYATDKPHTEDAIPIIDGTITTRGPLGSVNTKTYSATARSDATFSIATSKYGEWEFTGTRKYLDEVQKIVNISSRSQETGKLYLGLPKGSASIGIGTGSINVD